MRIAYCDHSFHKKTASTQFLSELLHKNSGYNIDYFWDDSWQGGKSIYFNQLKAYDIIVLFQVIPKNLPQNIAKVHQNVTFVPMLDQLGIARGPLFDLADFWRPFQGSKVLSFSTSVHAIAISNGIASEYFQYMPETSNMYRHRDSQYYAINPLRVFYWIRRPSDISHNVINTLLSDIKTGYALHVHYSPDPGEENIDNIELEDRLSHSNCQSVTISRWFEEKAELLNIIKDSDIFVSPRIEEGIGQAYLEAMAAGLCIIAPNNGTMNEYLINGINGLLYNVRHPKPLKFENIADIRINAYHTAVSIHHMWQEDEGRVMSFVLTPSSECYLPIHKYYAIRNSVYRNCLANLRFLNKLTRIIAANTKINKFHPMFRSLWALILLIFKYLNIFKTSVYKYLRHVMG